VTSFVNRRCCDNPRLDSHLSTELTPRLQETAAALAIRAPQPLRLPRSAFLSKLGPRQTEHATTINRVICIAEPTIVGASDNTYYVRNARYGCRDCRVSDMLPEKSSVSIPTARPLRLPVCHRRANRSCTTATGDAHYSVAQMYLGGPGRHGQSQCQ
jgi:hypothetical protein